MMVAADVRMTDAGPQVPSATVFRTARRLFQGEVVYQVAARVADTRLVSASA